MIPDRKPTLTEHTILLIVLAMFVALAVGIGLAIHESASQDQLKLRNELHSVTLDRDMLRGQFDALFLSHQQALREIDSLKKELETR